MPRHVGMLISIGKAPRRSPMSRTCAAADPEKFRSQIFFAPDNLGRGVRALISLNAVSSNVEAAFFRRLQIFISVARKLQPCTRNRAMVLVGLGVPAAAEG
jgi:hypothetical protein